MAEMKDIKKNQMEILELKDTIFKMKSSLGGLESRGTEDIAVKLSIQKHKEKEEMRVKRTENQQQLDSIS